jgi:hypothetical protein
VETTSPALRARCDIRAFSVANGYPLSGMLLMPVPDIGPTDQRATTAPRLTTRNTQHADLGVGAGCRYPREPYAYLTGGFDRRGSHRYIVGQTTFHFGISPIAARL